MSEFTCDVHEVHTDVVKEVSGAMPEGMFFLKIAELFKIFGDPTRMKIIWCLEGRELCVCDISNILGMTKSAISHQLSVLRQSNLVKYRRDGKNIYYSLTDEHIRQIVDAGTEHVSE